MHKVLHSLRRILLFEIRLPDPQLASRYYQFLFWVVAISVIGGVCLGLLFFMGTINSMEMSLLDLRLRYRTSTLHSAPSKDIVIIGIDEDTNKYIRLNPESGLTSLTLPRQMIAEITDYLADHGAKAVIFDLEFKDPKPGDELLAKAIRRHQYTYAADRMEYGLNAFIEEQTQAKLHATQRELGIYKRHLIERGLFIPYAAYRVGLAARFLPHPTVTEQELGYALSPRLLASLNFRNLKLEPYLPESVIAALPERPSSSIGNVYDRAFTDLCLDDYYALSHRTTPGFLSQLQRHALRLQVDGAIPEATDRAMSYCYTSPTVPVIMNSLTSIGIPSIEYYTDAYIRSATALYKGYQGHYYTYLGIRPALDLLGVEDIRYTQDALILDDRRVPLLDGQKIIINWRNPRLLVEQMLREHHLHPDGNPHMSEADRRARKWEIASIDPEKNNPLLGNGHIYRKISAIDVYRLARGQTLPSQEMGRMYSIPFYEKSGIFSFKDKIVIIGNTVTDIHRTPLSRTMFGPEVVAATLDMMLHDKTFIQKQTPEFQAGIAMLLMAAITLAVISFELVAMGFSVGLILIAFYWLGNFLIFTHLGQWLDLVVPTIAMGFSLIAATLYRYYIHDREKHHLTNVFSKYVSPQVMNEIIKNPEKALDNLRGGKKELTVLFSDLQDFTRQFENADPELMVSQLNEYFDVMTEIILNHGGTYDKYMGDSIMAFFGAPADMPDHAEMACRAAIEMQRALRTLNDGWAREGRPTLAHGVGISTGEMFVGNFGSKSIKNFTVMGSNVNLGSRLEAFTRVARWPVIISARTWDLTQHLIQVRDLGRIQVKGFSETVQVYGLESINPPKNASQLPENPAKRSEKAG